jgi:hypothetical protein
MRTIATIMVACALGACATAGSSGAGGDTSSSSGATNLLGRAEAFAGTALSVAKNFLSQQAAPTQQDKTQAAQTGVTAANTQAQQTQGSALSDVEQHALLNYLKSKL